MNKDYSIGANIQTGLISQFTVGNLLAISVEFQFKKMPSLNQGWHHFIQSGNRY